MAIRVVRNDAGNCITFYGSTNPVFWNACLSAEVDATDPTLINVINDIRSVQVSATVYEFYNIPYTDFVDADNNAFADATAAANYITEKANVLGSTGSFIASENDELDFSRDFTDTSILFSNGDHFGVNSIRAENVNGMVNIVEVGASGATLFSQYRYDNLTINGAAAGLTVDAAVNALNALFTVNPLGAGGTTPSVTVPVSGATASVSSAGTIDPVGTPIYGDDGTQSGFGRVFSTDFIREPGEYFLVNMTGKGRYTVGLYEEGVDTNLTRATTNAHLDQLYSQAFYNYGSYLGPWTTYGRQASLSYGPGWNGATSVQFRYNTTVQTNLAAGDPYQIKVGITDDGRVGVWYYDADRSNDYILVSKSSVGLQEGQYGLMITLHDQNAKVYDTPSRYATDPSGVELTYRYIESPDGSFYYPLFSTQEQAQYAAGEVFGDATSGVSSFIFIDEPTNSTWYMPSLSGVQDASSFTAIPSGVTYTEIQTEADENYAPAALTLPDQTVDETAAVNIQIVPQDTIATVSGLPAGLAYNNGFIQGTAPVVSGDYVGNPTDAYTIAVSRSNLYGTTSQTFELTVNNLTAPATAVSGFTYVSGTTLVDSDTLADGSVVAFDNTLDEGNRFVIPKSWVETYVLPSLVNDGDAVFLGISATSATFDSSITLDDFVAGIKWEKSGSTHISTIKAATTDSITINSITSAMYDYAFEAGGDDVLQVIACNFNNINTQPSVTNGGSFARTVSGTEVPPIELLLATSGSTMDFAEGDIIEIDIPLGANDFAVVETSETAATFNGGDVSAITLNAGYTYRFMLNDASIESGDTLTFETLDGTAYTSGVTTVGTHGEYLYYVEFAVPSDVPPLRVKWNTTVQGNPQISGSTFVTAVSGITLEGPVANQTGTNLFDSGDWGWLSIDEQLGAGERFVMDGAFLADLATAMPDDSYVNIAVKNPSGTVTQYGGFLGGLLLIERITASNTRIRITVGGSSTSTIYTTAAGLSNFEAFIEVANSGNNIRHGLRTSSNTSDDVLTTAYADWSSNYKLQTGDQGYGLTAVDVMVRGDTFAGNSAGMDSADVDWSGLSEISVPTPAATLTTSWTKALDFGGSSERTQQVNNNNLYSPLNLGGFNGFVAAPSTAGNTSNDSNARPWATAIVFTSDNNSSNQHIWNLGEGANSTDDNIYLRVDASRDLYFGWGRSGELNECLVASLSNTTGTWYGVYIASTGERVGGGHTAADIADCFDIRLVNLQTGATGSNLSTSTNWTSGSFGSRMNREFTGYMTIGGRGANRSFHGKVASMVVTTLRRNVAMPTDAEISMMVRDPEQWLTDYKVGNAYRSPASGSDTSNFQLNNYDPHHATQVWLMGDGTSDAYAYIRNQVYPAITNRTAMNMISMVSNDIETVNISGLT